MRRVFALGILCILNTAHVHPMRQPAALQARLSLPLPRTPQRIAADDADRLKVILRRVAEYIDTYEKAVPAIVADEDYTQRFSVEPRIEARHLESDLLTVRDESQGWVGFRDVYRVDGRPVRDRTERLSKLFLQPQSDSRSQAVRIAEERARFNVAPQVPRTVNVPLLALQFARSTNQQRSRFRLSGTKESNGVAMATVDFQERTTPGVIWTADGSLARGRLWIEPDSGRIRETELFVNTALRPKTVVSARIHVVYAEESHLHVWLPVSMNETYEVVGVIDGHATYSNFRRFSVSTAEDIKAP
jgi:hypothetical protein